MEKRFQFSIRFLLVATVFVCAGTAAVRAQPSIMSSLAMSCLSLLFTTSAIFGVTQTTGKLRAFWIGNAILLGPLASLAISVLVMSWPYVGQHGASGYPFAHLYGNVWPRWCAAPLNGLFAVFLHWLFSPHGDADRFPTTAAITLVLVLLVATFFGGMRFGEWREGSRRDREEQEQQEQDEMDEEAETG